MESFSLAIPPLSQSSTVPYPTPSSSYGQSVQETSLSTSVPRLWTGLWQLSSPAWGTAPAARIRREMRKHVDRGFVAFDMVSFFYLVILLLTIDNLWWMLGRPLWQRRTALCPPFPSSFDLDSPIQKGNFRSSLPQDLGVHVIGATKWCIFKAPQEPLGRQFVLDAVRERAKRMRVDAATPSKDAVRVDFLQFHWQDYSDKRYLQVLHILASLRSPATQLAYPTSTLHVQSKRLPPPSTSTSPSSVSTLTSSLRAAQSQSQEKLTISTKIDCYPSPSSSYHSSPSSSFHGALSPVKLASMEHEAVEKLAVHQQQQLQNGEGVRVGGIGLVNFDSMRVDEICASLGPGVILTNQVQFSLIDVRPLYAMADVCKRHGVKLLTYGTLCGGFLSDKWLDAPEPNRYFDEPTMRDPLTPSQKKYLDIILSAWGTWTLFQRLLRVLRIVADKRTLANNNSRRVSIANVATRWVLDHDEFVGAVIIGARLGVSDNTEDNLAVAGWRLNEDEKALIAAVLVESRGRELISSIGDCGNEYR